MEREQTIEVMPAAGTAPDTSEVTPDRRKYKRYPVELPAYVVGVPSPEKSDGYWEFMRPDSDPGLITNLSGAGLYFNSRAYFETSEQIWVAMSLDGEMQPVRGVVVYRHDFTDDNDREFFGYGIQFLRSEFAAAAVAAVLNYLNGLQNPGRRRIAVPSGSREVAITTGQ
jgi:hypothetical protein